jgi:putative hemolysin
MEDPLPALSTALAGILLFASGFFSLFDNALRLARKPGILKEADDSEKRAQAKRRGTVGYIRENAKAERYRRVLQAVENPGRHLVVSGFWLQCLRILAAAIAGTGVFENSWPDLQQHGTGAPFAVCVAAMVTAVLVIDYIAKSIARNAPEKIAAGLLVPLRLFALPLLPFLFFAGKFAALVKRIFPPETEGEGMTEDELRNALIEGEKSGIVESKERAMVEGVFYLGDRPLGVFMTHRSDIQWLDVNSSAEEIKTKLAQNEDQRCFPVADGELDSIIGAAYREDIIVDMLCGAPAGLRSVVKKPVFAPETMPALKAFGLFRGGRAGFLFVMDEYGGFAGMVSAWKLMEEIVGEIAGSGDETLRNEDGSFVVSGAVNIDDTAEMLALPGLSGSGDYHTLAGLVLSLSGVIPAAGDSFTYRGYRFTVAAMDGNRIDRVEISKVQ